ncbi:MAG TPA: 8-oxoguanine DNA glycosylase, partial [Eubacteriaceae bacterium]|nr:8-oxoguanine DNA glycosylase [Eubacteriaceae bacterium]
GATGAPQGQCFRWNTINEGHYIGIVEGKKIEIVQKKETFRFVDLKEEEFLHTIVPYFDLKRDYQNIFDFLSKDSVMTPVVEYGWGLRLLLQDEWETLLSFILSSNNNVKRIKMLVEKIAQTYGSIQIKEKDGSRFYAFPTVSQLQSVKEEDYRLLGCGYRSKYLVDAVSKIASGDVELSLLRKWDYQTGLNRLLQIKGIGQKVADCILLYGAGKYESYPADVWIKRMTNAFFFEQEATQKQIQAFAEEKWGQYAGFAQQYLFYYGREGEKTKVEGNQ